MDYCHPPPFRRESLALILSSYQSSYGGREAALQARAQEGMKIAKAEGKGVLAQAEEKGKELADEARRKANEVKDKVVR